MRWRIIPSSHWSFVSMSEPFRRAPRCWGCDRLLFAEIVIAAKVRFMYQRPTSASRDLRRMGDDDGHYFSKIDAALLTLIFEILRLRWPRDNDWRGRLLEWPWAAVTPARFHDCRDSLINDRWRYTPLLTVTGFCRWELTPTHHFMHNDKLSISRESEEGFLHWHIDFYASEDEVLMILSDRGRNLWYTHAAILRDTDFRFSTHEALTSKTLSFGSMHIKCYWCDTFF